MKKKSKKHPLPIREGSKDDRPREKLLKYGEQTLRNAELLTILIRTSTPGRTVTRTIVRSLVLQKELDKADTDKKRVIK